MAHGLVYLAAVAKAHFNLGRVNVDIDPGRINLQIQGVNRLLLAVQHIFISAACGVRQHLVAHKAAIDIAKLVIGARTGSVWNTGQARHMDGAGPVIDRHGVADKAVAQHIGQTPGNGIHAFASSAPLLHQLAFMPDGKADIGPGQGVAAHGFNAVGQLGGVGLQELAPRRGGEEQLLDLYRCALVAGGGAQLTAAGIEQEGRVLPRWARQDRGF